MGTLVDLSDLFEENVDRRIQRGDDAFLEQILYSDAARNRLGVGNSSIYQCHVHRILGPSPRFDISIAPDLTTVVLFLSTGNPDTGGSLIMADGQRVPPIAGRAVVLNLPAILIGLTEADRTDIICIVRYARTTRPTDPLHS